MSVLQKNRVVVAMSGGVDSSVAALLLKEQGLEVIGISMKTHETPINNATGNDFLPRGSGLASPSGPGGYGGTLPSIGRDVPQGQGGRMEVPALGGAPRSKPCCAAEDIRDARRVCQHLDIPFYPVNLQEEFRDVIDYFVSEYVRGRTPNPCVPCNDRLKFDALLQKARQLGAYSLATGHYVQKSRDRNGHYHLLKAKDREKDQSYFLFGLGQSQLEHLLFPVGRYGKEEVRELAQKAGLEVAEKPESQDICFVSTGRYAEFVEAKNPGLNGRKGVIVNEEGQVLGGHEGIHAFTIGQRRGLGVAGGERLYVTQILPEENKVVLGPKESLMRNGIQVAGVRWINPEPIVSGLEVETKIRYRHPGVPSSLTVLENAAVRVDFRQPDGAVTPGQAAVFYRGEELIGGGWIEKGL